ncbi:NAD(P)/FAD-dependent oxidoreductase [Salibacterium salarium]|uniref:NAD(P)/FAD-dependent oxidoreductase n=1 Tax=Salibacterium salarium TaxID=284579 RepID=A0A428MUN9_9BACI|nr:FAD-dependent oxidoreductase [Salibacterium salarium]RSL29849.1 NAD(P)/FAD-dependent oxidoreductase [Salibacterium salarium]
MKKKLIIIGNGMSSLRLMETIVSESKDAFSIQAFGEEPEFPYNRVKLSSYLQQEAEEHSLFPYSSDWYESRNIQIHKQEQVTYINEVQKQIHTRDGFVYSYDYLVMATGSSPVQLDIPGIDKEGVHTFRTLHDAKNLITAAYERKKAVVVGGGFLGLEAAYGLAKAGSEVVVIQRGDTLLNPQLDNTASSYLQKELEAYGIAFYFGQSVQSVEGNEQVKSVVLQDGTVIDTYIVLFATGIHPNKELAQESGLDTNRGIIVDDYMKTSAEDVYAIGECIEHNGQSYGLVPPVYEQARVAALDLCGKEPAPYNGSFPYSHLKIAGIDLFTAGKIEEPTQMDTIVQADSSKPLYQKIIMQNDVIQGAILFGDTAAADDIVLRIQNQKPLSIAEKNHLFSGEGKEEKLVQCSPAATICKCNQVNKQEILLHIAKEEKASVQTIRDNTKASSSCGGCTGDVAGLLSVFEQCKHQAQSASFCTCTTLEEETVRERINTGWWKQLDEVFFSVDWSSDGCDICKPALTYYFSIVGQMGRIRPPWIQQESSDYYVVTSLPIRNDDITDAMRLWMNLQHTIPSTQLKMGADRRIQLSGVPENEVEKVCTDTSTPFLAFPHAQLIPFEFSMSEGNYDVLEQLEVELFPLSFPEEFSMNVTKEFPAVIPGNGLTLVWNEYTWEMHVAGSDGRVILYVFQENELEEVIKVTIEYYRETAHFGESFSEWMIRKTPVMIRETILSEDYREELLSRLEHQIDFTDEARQYTKI